MFILNDPYRGAVHQPDVSIVAPIFHEGRLVAWAGSCAHQLDIGGMSFGSWSAQATEIQQEALLLTGVKLVEGDVIRRDIWTMIMGMSRLPRLLGLDFNAMIAANRVAIKRFKELMARYGGDTVEAIVAAEVDLSADRLRRKLAAVPDGVYRAIDYLDHDGHENRLYQVCVALEKRGDELTVDLEGTSPQAPGFINCSWSGMVGSVLTALLPVLAADIAWNEGLLHPITFKAPESSLANATWPAPVSGGTASGCWVVVNTALAAFSRLAACSAGIREHSQGVTKGSISILLLSAQNRDGGPYGNMLLDSTAGGGGGHDDHDGLDASGDFPVARPSISNVENAEAAGPLLYLYRRFVPDTGGAGRMRGGATTGLAITPHDVDQMHAVLLGHGSGVPNSVGMFGGLEGSCNMNFLRPGQDGDGSLVRDVYDAATLQALGETENVGPKPGHMLLGPGDVFAFAFQGGGGYGDALLRDPDSVLTDVEAGFVTEEAAEHLYGVVIAGGAVDRDATSARRTAIRTERLGGSAPAAEAAVVAAGDGELGIGPSLKRDAGGDLVCGCGQGLGPASGNWKDHAVARMVAPEEHGPHIVLHEELSLREHACPACGTLLEAEVIRGDAPSLHSIELW
jgi:N-methylhydantoinase B